MTPPQLPATPAHTVPEYLLHLWRKPLIRAAVYALLVLLAWRLARQVMGAIVLIGVAYAISYVVNPLLVWLEKRGLRRGGSILLILLGFLAVTGLLIWTVATQVTSFLAGLPVLLSRLPELVQGWLDPHRDIPAVAQMEDKLVTYLREKVSDVGANIGPITAEVLNPNSAIMGRLTGVLGWLGQATVVLTLAMFFMVDHAQPGRMLLGLLPRQWQSVAARLSEDVSQSFGIYLRGTLITGGVISLIAGAGLLALKVPNALALALLTGILALIPFFGMVLATIPVLLQAIPQGTNTLIGVSILYFAINQVAFNVVSPMVMGRASNISAAGIMVAVLIGASAFGLAGALLAIPAAILLQRWVTRYWLYSPAHEGIRPAPLAVEATPTPATDDDLLHSPFKQN
ncbi:AI-2E family transporter [Deinococcus cavernae]|uniref:AI-2E family transporter n=1 Tax=Deinococcus cavernae TaxID=2320857 RepID=A0A418V4T9_9DEIO|nr:AI-2E family transporter [Deinococcus cavernae]RJF71114.1 AI-2E family transporter [Deinococcus cavernae]